MNTEIMKIGYLTIVLVVCLGWIPLLERWEDGRMKRTKPRRRYLLPGRMTFWQYMLWWLQVCPWPRRADCWKCEGSFWTWRVNPQPEFCSPECHESWYTITDYPDKAAL